MSLRRVASYLMLVPGILCSAPLFAGPYIVLCNGGFFAQTGTDYISCSDGDFNNVDLADTSTLDGFLEDDLAPYYIAACTESFNSPPTDALHCTSGFMTWTGSNFRDIDPTYFYGYCSAPWEVDIDNVLRCDASRDQLQGADICAYSTTHNPATCAYEGGSSSSSSSSSSTSSSGGEYTGPTSEEVQALFEDGVTFFTYLSAIFSFFIGLLIGARSQ